MQKLGQFIGEKGADARLDAVPGTRHKKVTTCSGLDCLHGLGQAGDFKRYVESNTCSWYKCQFEILLRTLIITSSG